MSFLQPMLLAALPLVSLPIVIHLINQRRYQTMRWAAMMFLLAANRMARGYARLRQWLILLFRVLVVATLVFAISRPLASGWLGLAAGGRADTTIILLDRSPSMQQQGTGTAVSKLARGRQQLVRTLNTLGSSHWVLIDSATNKPTDLKSPDSLLNGVNTEPVSSAADLPAMLQTAHDYIKANQTGRTEIWICSDLRKNDWKAQSSRWQALRDSFLEFTQSIRFHLLAYVETAPENIVVRVTRIQRQPSSDGGELLVSVQLTREGQSTGKVRVPVQFELDGARSEVTIEMAGPQSELSDCRITLESHQKRGWGRVSIPADANPADNDFYFTFDEPPAHRTIIVAEDAQAARPLQLAASISPAPAFQCVAEVVSIEQLATVAWEQVALLLWQAPLPQGDLAELVRSFVERGGQAIFFPPHTPDTSTLFGATWQSWGNSSGQAHFSAITSSTEHANTRRKMSQTPTYGDVAVGTWRGDQDLLAHTQSGAALPVGHLSISRFCQLSGEFTALATLRGGMPLLARVTTDHGGAYFCATIPAPGYSSLATNGIVFYVAIQRALAAGARILGKTRQLVAGQPPAGLSTSWRRLAGADAALSTDYPHHQGAYAIGDRLLAINRDADEDHAAVLDESSVDRLFGGLDFSRVDDRADSRDSLIEEIWRLFLVTMMVAMVVEAGLCLQKVRRASRASS